MKKTHVSTAGALMSLFLTAGPNPLAGWPTSRIARTRRDPIGKRVPDTKAETDARAAVATAKAWNVGRRPHEKECVKLKKWRVMFNRRQG